MESFLPCSLGLSWAYSRESRADCSSQIMQLHTGQEGQVDMRWGVGKGENWECGIRRAASLWVCWLSELLHCPLCKETEFSFVISETPPPAFRRAGPYRGSLWWHTGGVGEPWRPLPFVNLSIKQCNCRLHNCCKQCWCLHHPLRSSLASAHLPQLSQRNWPNSDLTSPQPHWNGCGFIWIWMRSGPGPGFTGMVKAGVWSCTQIPAPMLVMQAVNPFKAALP